MIYQVTQVTPQIIYIINITFVVSHELRVGFYYRRQHKLGTQKRYFKLDLSLKSLSYGLTFMVPKILHMLLGGGWEWVKQFHSAETPMNHDNSQHGKGFVKLQ